MPKMLKGAGAVAVHMWHKHGYVAIERKFADPTGKCGHCKVEFHSRLRLLRHLAAGARSCSIVSCLAQMLICGHKQLSFEESATADAHDASEVKRLRSLGRTSGFAEIAATVSTRVSNRPAFGPLPKYFYHRFADVTRDAILDLDHGGVCNGSVFESEGGFGHCGFDGYEVE